MNIQEDRNRWRTANQHFRRGRRLYVFFMRHKLNAYRDDIIDFMAERMQERGYYSEKSDLRGIRQSIQSHLYRVESKPIRTGGMDWHNWLDRNHWDAYSGYSNRINKH